MWSRRDFGGTLAGAAISASFGLPFGIAQAAPRLHRIDIRAFAFDPQQLTVRPGDRIEWSNHDIAPHTATDEAGMWDSGELRKGESRVLEFSQPGQFDYSCSFHPSMIGRITVMAA